MIRITHYTPRLEAARVEAARVEAARVEAARVGARVWRLPLPCV